MNTHDMPIVLLVEDQTDYQTMVTKALEDFCTVVIAGSGEDGLAAIRVQHPELILMDVGMPGIDGYEACRRIKADPDTAGIPVLFVSRNDDLDYRLKGYEAGGQDYITKSHNLRELQGKVQHLLSMLSHRKELEQHASYASETAMTVMSNMGELGVLLDMLRQLNTCTDFQALNTKFAEGLSRFDLHGLVQIRSNAGVMTHSTQGEVSPLEESIIEHMIKMDRIVQFKTRLSVNYEKATLLINNMPIHDADACGRLRDHLAIMAETVDARVKAIDAMHDSEVRKVIETVVLQIATSLDQQRLNRLNTTHAVNDLTEQFSRSLLMVGLSDIQEDFLLDTIQQGVDRITIAQSAEVDLQNTLLHVIDKLKASLISTTTNLSKASSVAHEYV